MKKISLLFFVSIVCICCNSRPKPIAIPKMKLIMWDMITADEWMKLAVAKDSTIPLKKENISQYNKIFSLHKISKDEFFNSYTFYKTHPNQMKILLDSLTAFSIRKRDTLTYHIGK